jgi:hypothetical protein
VPSRAANRDPCDISLTTPLAHVRTAQAANLKPGEQLKVEVETVVNRKTIVCRHSRSGETVGFILARGAVALIECIEQGNEYVAEVKKIDFGLVEVMVRRSA